MSGLWDRLETLRAIADTARAEDIEQHPETVRTRYEPYAEAYFVIEAVERMEHRLIGELRQGRPVTGYVSADYGYGKTATAIYLWKRCLDSQIVAIPPFLFRQLRDVMQATKGWLAYQLRLTQPSFLPKLESAYQVRVERSLDELAREIARRESIPEAKARAIVETFIAKRRDVTTTHSLLDFLREATEVALEAGFKGLVVFADEVQEFVRVEETGARDAIQTLSELVKGVRTAANLPLGLILTMPVHPTEAAIEEQAGDIMQRMRERGTAVRLEDAYGRNFPRELWQHLCASFGAEAIGAVDKLTLEALGQLCERKDLSNGPRTVINVFKRVAQLYQQIHRPYTPINLMDDYLQGHIVFEGREEKLTRTLRLLLGLPSVQGDAARQNAVKLLAAFPRGVDEEKAGALYNVIVDLAEKERWLGEHITQLAEGYALLPLQEHTAPRPLLDEIIRDFRRKWHQTYREQQKAQLAIAAFLQDVLPMLFPQRSAGQYTNFGGHKRRAEEFEQVGGVMYTLLDGAFEQLFARFPDRKLCVAVSWDPQALTRFQPPADDVDLDVRFFVEFPENEDTPVRIETANQDRRVDIHVNFRRTFGREFPHDLGFLRNIMAPERTSAQVLLALSMRMWGWLHDHPETSEADRQMIEANRRALLRYAVQLLFPDASDVAKVQAHGIAASGAGQKLMESLFEAKCAELYPDYHPLMVTKEWKQHLRRYRDVLSQRPLAERRGHQPFCGSKDDVAKAFDWSRSAFESQSRTLQGMGLLELISWGGRGKETDAAVLFKEHPLEALLFETLQRDGRYKTISEDGRNRPVKSIEVSRLQDVARRKGYLPEEVEEALELLILRQRIVRQPDGTVQEFTGSLDAAELKGEAGQLEERLSRLAAHFSEELKGYESAIVKAREYLAYPEDPVALDAAHRKLRELQIRLEEFIKGKARELSNQVAALASELQQIGTQLEPRELEQQVVGASGFELQVDAQRRSLQRLFRQQRDECRRLEGEANQILQQLQGGADDAVLCRTVERYKEVLRSRDALKAEAGRLHDYVIGLQRWRETVAKATALLGRLGPDSPIRSKLEEELPAAIIQAFADQQLEALLDWERFRSEVATIDATLSAEESRRHNEFYQYKEQCEHILGKLTPQRMIQATFDPRDPEQSYEVLYQAVLRKLQDWLNEQNELAQGILDELEYLIHERGGKVEEERDVAYQARNRLQQAAAQLNREIATDLEQLQTYCKQLEEIRNELGTVRQRLTSKRAEKEPPTDEERPLLEVLTTQRQSLADLRRRLASSPWNLDSLFERLKALYRKGHVELEVRKRE